MKQRIWMIGLLAASLGISALAQETTVVAPAGVTPVAPAGGGKPAKSGGNPLFGMLGSGSKNGAEGGATNGMTIVSDRIEYDYKEMVIAFDEHVHVTDPQYQMTCDRLLVFLEGTNQIKRIIAAGKVDASQSDRHATCDKAVYEHATGEIVMTGNPVLTRGADRVVGTRITVYQSDQRMVVEGGGRVTLSPDTMKNREIKP